MSGYVEGTIEVVGVEPELTEIIMSMCNELTQLRLAFDASLYLKHEHMSWERLYELKQQSFEAYEEVRQAEREQRAKERKEQLVRK